MIQGRFGENGEIFFEIELISDDRLSIPVEAMLDTGFTEFLAINQQDLDSLDWMFLRQNKLKTAKGEAFFNVYLAKVIIDGHEFDVPVFAGDDIQEILLGSQWLKLFTLVANYKENRVTLE